MALSLRMPSLGRLWPSRRRIAPMPQAEFGRTESPVVEPLPEREDDYLVEGDEEPARPSPAAQAMQAAQLALICFIAVLSLAIFYLVGVLLNIF